MDIQKMINAAKKSGGGYACLRNYKAKSGSESTYYIRLGVTRAWALNQSILEGGQLCPIALAKRCNVDVATAKQAIADQIASWQKSLKGLQKTENLETFAASPGGTRVLAWATDKDTGLIVPDKGVVVRAIREGSIVHVPGKVRNPPVSALAQAKAQVRRAGPIGYHRQYNLQPDNFISMCFGGVTVTPTDVANMIAEAKQRIPVVAVP
jgi:hypothetical protein